MEINPLSIILVKSDSKGDRLLFRYPHLAKNTRDSSQCTKRKNPYSLTITEDLLQVNFRVTLSNIIVIGINQFFIDFLLTVFTLSNL